MITTIEMNVMNGNHICYMVVMIHIISYAIIVDCFIGTKGASVKEM